MAQEPEVLGRFVGKELGCWRPFAQMETSRNRVLYILVAANTIAGKPIPHEPETWPERWALLDITAKQCRAAWADWIAVGAAQLTREGIVLESPELYRSKVRRATGAWIDEETRQRIYNRDGHYCRYCGAHQTELSERLALDHVIPRSQGGTDHASNLVPACRSCNSRKGARTPDQAGMPLLKAGLRPGDTYRCSWGSEAALVLTDRGWHRAEGNEDG